MKKPPKRISVALPSATHAKYAAMAAARGMTLNAVICSTLFDALPKEPTAKPLSVAEQKAEHRLALKAKKQDEWRVMLASGEWTVQGILTSCQSWRTEAAQWLGEITRVLPTDMPLAGATQAEQQAILDARKRELEESMRGTPALDWQENEGE